VSREGHSPAYQAAEKRLQAVILSEALDRPVQGEAKNLCSRKMNQLQGSFVVPIRSGLLRMTASRGFSAACEAPPSQGLPNYSLASCRTQLVAASCARQGTGKPTERRFRRG
jgi:hypothetical protein